MASNWDGTWPQIWFYPDTNLWIETIQCLIYTLVTNVYHYYRIFVSSLLELKGILRHDPAHSHFIDGEHSTGLSRSCPTFTGERRKERSRLTPSPLFYQFPFREAAWGREGGRCPLQLEILPCSLGFGFQAGNVILITPCWVFSQNWNYKGCFYFLHLFKILFCSATLECTGERVFFFDVSTFHFILKWPHPGWQGLGFFPGSRGWRGGQLILSLACRGSSAVFFFSNAHLAHWLM